MDEGRLYFIVKVIFFVSFVLLTRCLSTGISLNRSTSERTSSFSSGAPSQLETTTATTTKFQSPPTISTYTTLRINKTWNCSEIKLQNKKYPHSNTSVYVYYTDYDPYVCHLNPLHCKRPQQRKSSGGKKSLMGLPVYGDYSYLPISLWILSLQHGAVVFLYHPCTSRENVEKLRAIARKCMRRHIITPYEGLNITQPIAMVAWASFYADWKVNETASETWIKKNALKGPASHLFIGGRYNFSLLRPARIVSDASDSELCPKTIKLSTDEEDLDLLKEHFTAIGQHGHSSKSLKKHLIQKLKHGMRHERRQRNSGQAAWAVGSLLFLCLILVFVLMYTKPWNEKDYYLKEKIASRNNNTGFSMLKSHFGRGGRTWRELAEQQRYASSSRRLLGPIHEEEEDFMDL